VRTGAVGQEEFNHVTAQLAAAKSGLAAAQSAPRRRASSSPRTSR
jgi:multidrug resistance efflux pump